MRINLNLLGIALTTLLMLSCNTDESSYQKFIGKEFRDLSEIRFFKNFKNIGGTMIQKLENIDYAINLYEKDSLVILIFEQLIPTGTKRPNHKILDILEIRDLKKSQNINYGMCRLNKSQDSEIIAIYYGDYDEKYFTKIFKAWRADRKTKKIIQIDTKGIDCINISYGD